jgi:hypothetical protein
MTAVPPFQIVAGSAGSNTAATLPATLRPWGRIPPAQPSYSPGESMPDVEGMWRIVLPADEESARRQLHDAARELDRVVAALPLAEQRFPAAMMPASFAAGDVGAAPEISLRAALQEISGTSPVSRGGFGLGERLTPALEKAQKALSDALDYLRRMVTGRSWVETRTEGVLIARTLLGRTGDQATAWRAGSIEHDAYLHAKAVAMAQRSRAALARTIALAIRGAGLIAPLLSGPVGFLVALPAAWKFFDDVVAEISAARTP